MKFKWLGDGDHQETTAHGITFPKGEAVEVPDGHPLVAKLKGSKAFEEVAAKADKASKSDTAKADKA